MPCSLLISLSHSLCSMLCGILCVMLCMLHETCCLFVCGTRRSFVVFCLCTQVWLQDKAPPPEATPPSSPCLLPPLSSTSSWPKRNGLYACPVCLSWAWLSGPASIALTQFSTWDAKLRDLQITARRVVVVVVRQTGGQTACHDCICIVQFGPISQSVSLVWLTPF